MGYKIQGGRVRRTTAPPKPEPAGAGTSLARAEIVATPARMAAIGLTGRKLGVYSISRRLRN